MVSASAGEDNSNLIHKTLEWIADAGINGLGVLPSAEQVAADHLSKAASIEDAINSVIAWNTTYAAGTGFITGLGGIAAMPITMPAGLAASYALGANTAAAVAHLRGTESDQSHGVGVSQLIGRPQRTFLSYVAIGIGISEPRARGQGGDLAELSAAAIGKQDGIVTRQSTSSVMTVPPIFSRRAK